MSFVTLQVNLAPADLPHAKYTLPHQLRQWSKQVDEIVLVVDLHQSRGRYAEAWEKRLPGLRRLVDGCCAEYDHAHSVDVDYSPDVARRLSAKYFGGAEIPAKDWNGAPFYAYFFGLDAAANDYVLHMDSDMMFGGGSSTWVTEAIQLLRERSDVLICNPLPGPPTTDGQLRSQTLPMEPFTSLAFRSTGLSTRIFLMDVRRFHHCMKHLTLTRPATRRVWQARADGNPPYETAELIWTHAMAKHGLLRIDFLGRAPGMWTLHPLHRSPLFYERLPALIEAIEAGMVPEAQRGHHDLNDSMVDCSDARKPRWRRVAKHQRLFIDNVAGKLGRVRRQVARIPDA
jgi:hypothetical protein